jgi:hypothetical protein
MRVLEQIRKLIINSRLLTRLVKGGGSVCAPKIQLTDFDLTDSNFIVYAHYFYWKLTNFIADIVSSRCLAPLKSNMRMFQREVIRALLQWVRKTLMGNIRAAMKKYLVADPSMELPESLASSS